MKAIAKWFFLLLSISLAITWAYVAMAHNWSIPAAAKTLSDDFEGFGWAVAAFVAFGVSGACK